MEQNIKLLSAIREKGLRQNSFAEMVGDHHTFVSRVINGWVNLDQKRKEKYAKVLECNVSELFD